MPTYCTKMLAYEKGRQSSRTMPWWSRCFALIFFLPVLIIADSEYRRRSRCQRLSFLMFYHYVIFFAYICGANSLLFSDFLRAQRLLRPCRCSQTTPQSYAFSLESLLFSQFFDGKRAGDEFFCVWFKKVRFVACGRGEEGVCEGTCCCKLLMQSILCDIYCGLVCV